MHDLLKYEHLYIIKSSIKKKSYINFFFWLDSLPLNYYIDYDVVRLLKQIWGMGGKGWGLSS